MADTTTPSKEAMEEALWLRRASEGDIARALDAFAAPYKARAKAAERALEDEQKAHLNTVDQRDEAEDAISQIYTAVTGRMPEWSNAFCYLDALHDVEANITACFAEAEAEKAKREAEAHGMDDDDRRLRAELDQMRRDGLITYDASADEWKITDKGRLALLEDSEAFH